VNEPLVVEHEATCDCDLEGNYTDPRCDTKWEDDITISEVRELQRPTEAASSGWNLAVNTVALYLTERLRNVRDSR